MSQFAVDAESLGTVNSVNVPNSSKPEQRKEGQQLHVCKWCAVKFWYNYLKDIL